MEPLDFIPQPALAQRIRDGISKHLDEVNPPSSLDDDALCLMAQGFGSTVDWSKMPPVVTMTPNQLRLMLRAEVRSV